MPVYQYRGFDAKGKAKSGIKDADSPRALRQALRREGILLSEVRESTVAKAARKGQSGKAAGKTAAGEGGAAIGAQGTIAELLESLHLDGLLEWWVARQSRAQPAEVAVLTRQLGTLLRAGVQLSESLQALIEQSEDPVLKRVLSDVKVQVNEGLPLSQALGRHPGAFSELYVNLVTAGEAAGNLEAVLLRLADFLESQNKLRSKIVSALVYPAVMAVVAVLILSMLMTTVVPKVTAIFTDTGRALPINTQILIFVSAVLSDYLWLVVPLLLLGIYLFRRWQRSPNGRYKWDQLVLKLPVMGALARKVAVSRFAKTLATMLASGVQLLRAMEIVKNVLGNSVLTKVVEEARESIREGESIAQPLRRSGQFPAIVCHMIAVGERSGQLEQMLENVANTYDLEVDIAVGRMTTLLEPLMILFMGGAVGFVVFSILMPIMEMNQFVQ
jgi:general secretion pathway protein F